MGSQFGAISVGQLAAIGLDRKAVRHRVSAARLWRVHQGVYATSPVQLSRLGRLKAAELAVAGGVISHRSAAQVHGLLGGPVAPVHISTNGAGHSRRGITVHRYAALTENEIAERERIRTTSIARTLLDLAGTESRETVGKAIREAEYRRLLNLGEVVRMLELRPSAKGTRALATLVGTLSEDPARTRTELERTFARLCADAGLPKPRFNEPMTLIDGSEVAVDAMWRKHRVIAELDSRRAHATMTAFESDRSRDAQLTAAGWRVVRFTWRQVINQPAKVAGFVRRVLEEPSRKD